MSEANAKPVDRGAIPLSAVWDDGGGINVRDVLEKSGFTENNIRERE